MHFTDKTHFFRDENDDRVVVITRLLPDGSYEAETVCGTQEAGNVASMYGHGSTRMEAIHNLQKQIDEEMK